MNRAFRSLVLSTAMFCSAYANTVAANARDDYNAALKTMGKSGHAEQMRTAANNGDPRAMYWMAFYYRKGLSGLDVDALQAQQWASKATYAGLKQGVGLWAEIALNGGPNFKIDLDEAESKGRIGCQAESAEACAVLGDMAQFGKGKVKKNAALAAQFYKKAIDDAKKERDPTLEDLGPVHSGYQLALMTARGEGVEKNKMLAQQLLIEARALPMARFHNSSALLFGQDLLLGAEGRLGFARDTEKGKAVLEDLINRGQAIEATNSMGVWTYYGRYGLVKNAEQGIALLQTAASKGYIPSMLALANIFAAADKDGEAFRWVQLAAKGESPEGTFLQSVHYYQGMGVKEDEAQGKSSMLKSCELNSLKACAFLEKAHTEGLRGFPRDLAAARKYAEKVRKIEADEDDN
jgi:TPR repeat protein